MAKKNARYDSFIVPYRGCPFDLLYLPGKAVVSGLIPHRAFGIVIDLPDDDACRCTDQKQIEVANPLH
jgi:hypothetical protein